MLSFWVFNRTVMLFMERFDVLFTVLAFVLLSAISARVFRTYSGIVRYSSFVDLLNVAYANGLSMVMALVMTWVAESQGVLYLSALNQSQTVITFVGATLAMWGVRVLVKNLYDIAATDKHAQKVLIYGAMSGGVGLAKNIRSQKPKRFVLAGFISHDPRAKHLLLMGKPVYNVTDD